MIVFRNRRINLFNTALRAGLLVACWMAFTGAGYAQQWPFQFWHEGRIILLQGDTLKGAVKYDLEQNVVQFGTGGGTFEAFSSRKVLFFEIFDKSVNKYRQFYALPYTRAGSYATPTFFELLEDGKMTLLAREALEYRTYSYGFYGGSYTRQILVHKYFFLDDRGNIEEFTGGRAELLNMMGKSADHVEKYIRSNRLKFDDKYDFARIIEYYNSLHGS
jgi:hypothetical protein